MSTILRVLLRIGYARGSSGGHRRKKTLPASGVSARCERRGPGSMGKAMASLLSPRQIRSRLSLRATEPTADRPDADGPGGDLPSWSWLLAAAGGALVTALAGWVLVAGLSVVGWVTSEPGTLGRRTGRRNGAVAAGQRRRRTGRRSDHHAGALGFRLPHRVSDRTLRRIRRSATAARQRIGRAQRRGGHDGGLSRPVDGHRAASRPALSGRTRSRRDEPARSGGGRLGCGPGPRTTGPWSAGRPGRGRCPGPCSRPNW